MDFISVYRVWNSGPNVFPYLPRYYSDSHSNQQSRGYPLLCSFHLFSFPLFCPSLALPGLIFEQYPYVPCANSSLSRYLNTHTQTSRRLSSVHWNTYVWFVRKVVILIFSNEHWRVKLNYGSCEQFVHDNEVNCYVIPSRVVDGRV